MSDNGFAGKTILIVEDFDDTRLMLKQYLELKGCRVVEGINGHDAIELAVRERPNLILMDLRMPNLDGFMATRLIREIKELDGVPVVAVTAYDTMGLEFSNTVDELGVGNIECISKPIALDKLEEVLLRLLPAVSV